MALDPADLGRVSAVKEWTAQVRLKYQLHNRGDHYEVEFLALPKANGISIRYTTDGSSPTTSGYATYNGPFRVPAHCRIVCAMAVASAYAINSEVIRILIPQKGEEQRTLDPAIPARWNQQTRLDDPGAVWDFLQQFQRIASVRAYDIGLTAESSDRQQHVDYSGALDAGYSAADLISVAQKLQDIVGGGHLRLTIGSIRFPTGQALLDWLKATQQAFNQVRVGQG